MGQSSTKLSPPSRIKEVLNKYPTFVSLRHESINYLSDKYDKKKFENDKPKVRTGLYSLVEFGRRDVYFTGSNIPSPPTKKELEMEIKVEEEIKRLKDQGINMSDKEKCALEDAIVNVIANDQFHMCSVFNTGEDVLYSDPPTIISSYERKKERQMCSTRQQSV